MAARAERVNLDERLLDADHGVQEQRIATARRRASPQDDRRTPNPDEDPWVSTGDGVLLLRVPHATARPAAGAAAPSVPSAAMRAPAAPTAPAAAPPPAPQVLTASMGFGCNAQPGHPSGLAWGVLGMFGSLVAALRRRRRPTA